MLETLLLIIVVLWILGSIPTWSYSRAWGPGPSIVGLVVLIVLVLLLFGGGLHLHRLT